MNPTCDVAVLGGGPSGLAAAIRLSQLGRSVRVWTRPASEGPRVGESIGPEVVDLLARFGLEAGFEQIPQIPFAGVRIFWGDPEGYERPGIFNALGLGRHLDRAAFDEWIGARALERGVEIRFDCSVGDVSLQAGGWQVCETRPRFVVDARGRGPARGLPLREWVPLDRLVGVAGWFQGLGGSERDDSELLIEAVPSGWWYSAPLPGDRLAVTLMTDVDLLQTKDLQAEWDASLSDAPNTSKRLGGLQSLSRLVVRRAESGYSSLSRGQHWVAAGDASFARDPLAGTGIHSALRSGFAAAEAVHTALEEGSEPDSPHPMVLAYLRERASYYSRETRWPSHRFWARRTDFAADGFQCRLNPETQLCQRPGTPDPITLARAESLLPYKAIANLLRFLETPRPAHVAIRVLKEEWCGPIDDGLLIAGLQFLVDQGILIESV